MPEQLIFWIIVEEDEPKISDIHKIYDQSQNFIYHSATCKLGLILTEKQYQHFYGQLMKMFCLKDDPLLTGFMGFSIKVIRNDIRDKEQQCSEK